jgi:hypothetical protein
MTKTKTPEQVAEVLAKDLGAKLRQVAQDMQDEVDKFRKYADSWSDLPAETSPLAYREPYVGIRALEMLEGVTHIHTGSTAHMHFRAARDAAIKLVSNGEPEPWL